MTTNRLAACSSPYLLQHAHNPVDWYPWGDEAWEKAQSENKLVLVSIGYSACHWCHVMEREVFERQEAAHEMNAHLVSIKVDREERPDVDQVYMTALQLMTGQGGWPLNVFCLPDGRPVFGGTYFPLERWLSVLEKLTELQERDYGKLEEYAEKLVEGVRQSAYIASSEEQETDPEWIHRVVNHWKQYWDTGRGGAAKAPKFPMPVNSDFLLHYATAFHDKSAMDFVQLTLDEMHRGGIYDQIGGGFARYSVDEEWKVPHFEKMLYDNAQLISVYSKAFQATGRSEWKDVITQSMNFITRELTSPEGLFFSALDADSEGVEGKYYIWTAQEVQEVLNEDYGIASRYYRIGKEGEWEHGQNILLRRTDDARFAEDEGMTEKSWSQKRRHIEQALLKQRQKRVRPGLDHKIITSWNALMIKGACDAWKATGNDDYKRIATRAANAYRNAIQQHGGLFRLYHEGAAGGAAFLDDYAHIMDAWLSVYECTGESYWLEETNHLMLHAMDHFSDDATGLFWFTSDEGEQLFARPHEIADNVMPSANSTISSVLFLLGKHLEKPHYIVRSRKMLQSVMPHIDYGASWSNWLRVHLWHTLSFYEVVTCGPEADQRQQEWNRGYYPNALFAASTTERSLPLIRGRIRPDTPVYVCTGNTCLAPMASIAEALEQLK
jgi:uncharacterized protein YyaL (SSP411 family)